MQKALEIILRYVVMVAIAVMALVFPIFYTIFRPLTMWPTAWILSANVSGTSIIVDGHIIEIIDACVAGSAYLLLLLLNLLTRDIGFGKRIGVFLLDSSALLVLNVLRLVILIPMAVSGSLLFDVAHKLFWYVMSTVFVALIWVFSCIIFRIRTVPFVSDVKFLTAAKKTK